jgi:hypothetical protein
MGLLPMETTNSSETKRFDGLGALIVIAGLLLFSPLCYFLINVILGNAPLVDGQ